MPSALKWIILVLVAMVALSPLGEFFDRTDEWPQDGSDFVLYIICLFCFLGLSMTPRANVIIARVASSGIAIQAPVRRSLLERNQRRINSEERALFLTFCDLRV